MRTVSALLIALAATALPAAAATAQVAGGNYQNGDDRDGDDRDGDYGDDRDGGYPDDGSYGAYGYPPAVPDERDYGTRPPPPGRARPMPSYRDDNDWRSGEDWSSTDARRAAAEGDAPPPPVAPRAGRGDRQAYRAAQADYRARLDAWNRRYGAQAGAAAGSRYADRVARWRARADACEGGDRAACEGPE